MKLLLALTLSLFAFSSFAQELTNRKVISLNLFDISGSISSSDASTGGTSVPGNRNQGIRFSLGGSFGKINSRNMAISYGIALCACLKLLKHVKPIVLPLSYEIPSPYF